MEYCEETDIIEFQKHHGIRSSRTPRSSASSADKSPEVSQCAHECKQGLLSLTYHSKSARVVYVTGSFVNWDLLIGLDSVRPGEWRLRLRVPVGHHAFRLVVDGYWRIDEGYTIMADKNGHIHNVVHVD